MDHELRVERRRVRLFFAGLLVVSGVLDIVGALLVQHQTRTEVLETLSRTNCSPKSAWCGHWSRSSRRLPAARPLTGR